MLQLISADMQYNMLMGYDPLRIKVRCKNTGCAIKDRMTACVEMQFGHQRNYDALPKRRRTYFEILPHRTIETGQVFEFGINFPARVAYKIGTYSVRLEIETAFKVLTPLTMIGEIEMSCSWGRQHMERDRRPVHMEFAPIEPITERKPREPFDLHFTYFDGEKTFGDDDYSAQKIGDSVYRITTGKGAGFTLTQSEGYEFTDFCEGEVQLTEINIPLIQKRKGKAAIFFDGGRLVDIESAWPCGYESVYDVRLATMAYEQGGDIAYAEMHCPDDRLYIGKTDAGFEAIGIVCHRVLSGNKTIVVNDNHRITVENIPATGLEGWQTAAVHLQNKLPVVDLGLYKDRIFHCFLATEGGEVPEGFIKKTSEYPIKRLGNTMKFKDIEKVIFEYHNFFGGIKQLPYIGGFQWGGFDNGFMEAFEDTDHRCGTKEELRSVIENCKSIDAVVGLHDNFDDNNLDRYHELMCREYDGSLWKGWFWAGGMTHIVCPSKYIKSGEAQKKIKKMVKTYGLHTSTHLDVISSEPLRWDFDPECPTTATDNLKAKLQIIQEFNKYGINITVEAMTHAFAGHSPYAIGSRDAYEHSYFIGDTPIPLASMIYHGTFPHANGCDNDKLLMWSILKGEIVQIEGYHYKKIQADRIYCVNIPVHLLLDRKIERYELNGAKCKAIYGADSYTAVDFDELEYEIVVDGITHSKNFNAFVPCPDGYILYSRDGGDVSFLLPEDARGASFGGVELSFEGERDAVAVRNDGGTIRATLKAGVPVKVRQR